MKYLIVGLGNVGSEFDNTRHNIGFNVLDELAKESQVQFEDCRHGVGTHFKYKGRTFILLKPSTYVNLSGKAVNYWLKTEKIALEHLLVIVDDLALPFGSLRIKAKGSHAGHNGLKNIEETLGHNQYARLRFGIGDNFRKGQQVQHVLGKWSHEEAAALPSLVEQCSDIIKSFGTIGITRTMNVHNKR